MFLNVTFYILFLYSMIVFMFGQNYIYKMVKWKYSLCPRCLLCAFTLVFIRCAVTLCLFMSPFPIYHIQRIIIILKPGGLKQFTGFSVTWHADTQQNVQSNKTSFLICAPNHSSWFLCCCILRFTDMKCSQVLVCGVIKV